MTGSTRGPIRDISRWDVISLVSLQLLTIVLLFYVSFYDQPYVAEVNGPGVVLLFDLYLTMLVITFMGLRSYVGERTPVVMTEAGTFRFASAEYYGLPPVGGGGPSATALRRAGIDLTKLGVKDEEVPVAGTDEKGRIVPAGYYRLGGYRIRNWFWPGGREGYLICLGAGSKPGDVGDTDRGGVYFLPRTIIQVPHNRVPEEWMTVIRDDREFTGPKSKIYMTVGISPEFVANIVLPNARLLKSPLENGTLENSVLGDLTVHAAVGFWGRAEELVNYLSGRVKYLEEELGHHDRRKALEAGRDARMYGRPDRRPSVYPNTDDRNYAETSRQ